MTHKLHIAENLSLPIEAVTTTIAVLAKRRAGKSFCMRRFVEQLIYAGQQVVIVDPKGDQWGIRSDASGKGPGLSVVILGGERGDVALEPGAGELVAKLVVEERVSVLLDISVFRKHEVATFMAVFLEQLYRLKAHERFRTPTMLVIDEADAIAPQVPQANEARMLGAAEDIVRRGGQRGLGCMLVTQRSAVLNKNVLTQAEILVALRTIAPQDLKAMKAWIDVHGSIEQQKTLMESLPALPVGDAWFWSPGWPTADGIFKRVHVLPIDTFDSGATPKPGEKRVEPKRAADVDLEALKRQMAETIERAKADDPKELRKRIAELERELKAKPTTTIDAKGTERAINLALQARDKHWEKIVAELDSARRSLTTKAGKINRLAAEIEQLATLNGESGPKTLKPEPASEPQTVAQVKHVENRPILPSVAETRSNYAPEYRQSGSIGKSTGLTRAQQRIIDALAWLESIGNASPTLTQIGAVALIDPTGGYFSNTVSPLSSQGLIQRDHGQITLTESGRAMANTIEQPATLVEYHDVLRSRVRRMKSASNKTISILDAIIAADGQPLTNDQIGESVGIDTSGGYFSNSIGPLSTAGLIKRSSGTVYPTNVIFPSGLH